MCMQLQPHLTLPTYLYSTHPTPLTSTQLNSTQLNSTPLTSHCRHVVWLQLLLPHLQVPQLPPKELLAQLSPTVAWSQACKGGSSGSSSSSISFDRFYKLLFELVGAVCAHVHAFSYAGFISCLLSQVRWQTLMLTKQSNRLGWAGGPINISTACVHTNTLSSPISYLLHCPHPPHTHSPAP